MIVQTDGSCESLSGVTSRTSKIVSTTGTAYVNKGKLKAVIRFVKKIVRIVKSFFRELLTIPFVVKMNTKSGIPTNLAPPSMER